MLQEKLRQKLDYYLSNAAKPRFSDEKKLFFDYKHQNFYILAYDYVASCQNPGNLLELSHEESSSTILERCRLFTHMKLKESDND